MKKSNNKKVKINRFEALTNCVYFHGHFHAYIAIVMVILGCYFINIIPIIAALVIIYPQYVYMIDILIGKAIPVKGTIISEKPSVLYTIFKLNGEDNYCNKTIMKNEDGKKVKFLCYESTIATTYKNKVKVKQHKSGFDCTVYYLPLSRVVVDIDYKYKYKKKKG